MKSNKIPVAVIRVVTYEPSPVSEWVAISLNTTKEMARNPDKGALLLQLKELNAEPKRILNEWN